jgi:hypothetical protein
VEVLKQGEVFGLKVAEVFPGGYERLRDGLPGRAGRVLGRDLDVCHVNAFQAGTARGQRDAVPVAGGCSVHPARLLR